MSNTRLSRAAQHGKHGTFIGSMAAFYRNYDPVSSLADSRVSVSYKEQGTLPVHVPTSPISFALLHWHQPGATNLWSQGY